MAEWLSTVTFSRLAGMSERRARKIFGEVESGVRVSWQGAALRVRALHGHPGRSGKNFTVDGASLPPDLQARFKALQTPVEGGSNHLAGHGSERAWWLRILGPALDTAKGSLARKAAFQRAIAETNTNWRGDKIKLTMRHLQQRMALLEEGGVGALGRLGRADRGGKRTVISRQWDAAVPFSAELKAQIAAVVKLNLAGLFKAGMRFGQAASFASAVSGIADAFNALKAAVAGFSMPSFGFSAPNYGAGARTPDQQKVEQGLKDQSDYSPFGPPAANPAPASAPQKQSAIAANRQFAQIVLFSGR